MVALPDFTLDPTLEAMHSSVEAFANQEPRRDYLGASQLGSVCERKVYYSITNAPRSPKKARLIYAAQDGYHVEDIVAERLRMVSGIELWTHDNNGKQFEFTDFDGELKGHPDGIVLGLLQAPRTAHIWECKSKSHKLYNEFLNAKEKHGDKNCLREWHHEYFVQAQLLMHYFEITRHYMTVCLAGGRDISSCRTEYDKQFALAQIEKAKRLIDAKKNGTIPARISEYKSHHYCKNMCDHVDYCWRE